MKIGQTLWHLALALLLIVAPAASTLSVACILLGQPTKRAAILTENFEAGTKASYAIATVTLSTGSWTFNDALIGNLSTDLKSGTQSARVRNSGKLTMNFDKTGGAGVVTVYSGNFGADAGGTWQLWYSTNGGTTYTQAGSTITAPNALTATSFTLNVAGNVRLDIRKTDAGTNRINFDDVTITDYTISSNPVPVLSSISPTSAIAGSASTTLTVTGSSFVSTSVVNWNGAQLATTYISATMLTATILTSNLASAGTASVTVTSPTPGGGTSGSATFTIIAPNPAPVLTAISPTSSTAGASSITLTVTGSSFIPSSVVNWNGAALATTYLSSTQLSATILTGMLATAGTASVTVVTGAPGGGTSTAATFTINNPAPALTTISPSSANAGSSALSLSVTGSAFISSSKVNWNGAALTTTFVSATQLTATVPAANLTTASTASVTVSTPTPGGGTSSAATFTINAVVINPVPVLNSISPTSATAGATALTLTVNGSSFISTSTVNWNGAALTTAYVSATQLTATVPAANLTTAGSASVTVFTPTPGGGTSSAAMFTINGVVSGAKKFLFNATKAETAGNADWVIDEDNSTPQRIPTPAQSTITSSTVETYWTGALSSWGIALVKRGHNVETLPSGGAITYGNASNAQDLSNYDVFIDDEPNTKYTSAEQTALMNFVKNGGGLILIADHNSSDRNNDGCDSPCVINDLFTNNSVKSNPFGLAVELTNFSGSSTNVWTGGATNPILSGSAGSVSSVNWSSGSSISISTSANSTAQGLIWKSGVAQGSTSALAASSTYGTGRFFLFSDSSPADDGTGAPGNTLYVGWSTNSHSQLLLNASLWAAKLQ